jgi:hypothetical protein
MDMAVVVNLTSMDAVTSRAGLDLEEVTRLRRESRPFKHSSSKP